MFKQAAISIALIIELTIIACGQLLVVSEDSKAFMVARLALFITTRLMLNATAEELRGIVAHELAHDYVWNERLNALRANNGKSGSANYCAMLWLHLR